MGLRYRKFVLFDLLGLLLWVRVAAKLRDLGFKRVRPLHGGIDAWIDAGHDVER
jgi:3-mercaptopyruvate sulfurtransferase SseA